MGDMKGNNQKLGEWEAQALRGHGQNISQLPSLKKKRSKHRDTTSSLLGCLLKMTATKELQVESFTDEDVPF